MHKSIVKKDYKAFKSLRAHYVYFQSAASSLNESVGGRYITKLQLNKNIPDE